MGRRRQISMYTKPGLSLIPATRSLVAAYLVVTRSTFQAVYHVSFYHSVLTARE